MPVNLSYFERSPSNPVPAVIPVSIQPQPTERTSPTMTRSDCLKAALSIVEGEREATYGTPEDSFATIAAFWRVYLQGRVAGSIDAADVGVMMMLLKVARLSHRKDHLDSLVDAAGYAACVAEIVSRDPS